jgi:hypothetical protein
MTLRARSTLVALGVAQLREMSAPRAARVRSASHSLGTECVERQAETMCALHRLRSQGATIQHPGWGGENIGFMPFPVALKAAN